MFLVATFSTFRTLCCSFPFINRKKKMTMHREKKRKEAGNYSPNRSVPPKTHRRALFSALEIMWVSPPF